MKKFKQILSILAIGVMGFAMVGCASDQQDPATTPAPTQEATQDQGEADATTAPEAATTQKVTVPNAEGQPVEVEFPVDPQRIVALNWQTVDFLDAVGKGDQIVGMIKSGTYPEHLKKYVDNEEIVNVGGMKDIDMEAVMSLEPDAIFSSDRTKSKYDDFSKIAPTFAAYVAYDGDGGFMDGYKKLAATHAQIFNVAGEVDEIIKGYDERIAKIAEFAEGKTALLGIFAGGLNTLGNQGRASVVVNEMGFENLAGDENVNHGNISSYEAWLELNPDWMFILDKDTAVGTEAVAAKEQMEVNNPVIAETTAFKNGQIVYLEPGNVWYVADGGITSLDMMISCIEQGIGLK